MTRITLRTRTAPPTRAPLRNRLRDVPAWVFLTLVSVSFLLPVIWVFSTSLKPTADIFKVPSTLFPHHITGENYQAVAGSDGLLHFMANSLVAAGGSTLIALLLAIPAAFAFAKLPFRLSGLYFAAAVL